MFMRIVFLIFIVALLSYFGCKESKKDPGPIIESESREFQPIEPLNELIRDRIESAGIPPQISVTSEIIYASLVLPKFYVDRGYQPVWLSNNTISPQATALIEMISVADEDGLHPDDYHLQIIKSALQRIKQQKPVNAYELVDLDLLLTDAFLVYGSHLLVGKINPQTIDPEWFVNLREGNIADTLEKALEMNQVKQALENLMPVHMDYERLKNALAYYRKIAAAGGWPMVPGGTKLQKGDQNPRVIQLRQRLIGAGDLDSALTDSSMNFDEHVEYALRKFQQRHGLEVDGVLGPTTLANLNVPVEERISTVELNLERWRWLPQNLERHHILVNIANFELDVFDSNRIVLSMRVMVGKDYRRTPVFSDRMTYMVFCPYWHVPPNMARNDILPAIRKDANYLTKQKIKVFRGWGAQAQEIDPTTVDWAQITGRNLPYHFRQDPGPQNALGRVKFMFPNQFNVYLHDTPAQRLFARTERNFSSGCIRIEKPIELAVYLLRNNPAWDEARIKAVINRWTEQTVLLPQPMPIHILYWTAWANADGSINFRRDIYNRDKRLLAALNKEPPHEK